MMRAGLAGARSGAVRLREKVVLITGAASGLGRVAVRMFAAQGARIVAADVAADGLQAAVAEAGEQHGDAIVPRVGDAAKGDDVERMVAAGVERFGTLNVLYNNAGIMPDEDSSVLATDEATWERVLDVNL